jgi:amino acid permease
VEFIWRQSKHNWSLRNVRFVGHCTFACHFPQITSGFLVSESLIKKITRSIRLAVVLAMLTTSLSVLLILLGSLLDLPKCAPNAHHPQFKTSKFFLSIGIFFAFGGHSVFPSIQHDMRRPRQFTRSSLLAFLSEFVIPYIEC